MEIYDIPEEWKVVPYKQAIRNISITNCKIKQKDYLTSGLLPIVDQGAEKIGGYTNDIKKKVDCQLPVIVFGDHTKIVKFINFEFVSGADGVKVLQPLNIYVPKFFAFLTQVVSQQIEDRGYARHYQYIEKMNIPIPPLAEQKEIVSILEKLLSNIDKGVENLKEAKEQLKVYRQSVLKDAFEGKLTEEWRKKNPDKLESAEILLEKIQKAREEYYNKQIEEWEQEVKELEEGGKGGRKPSKPQKLTILNIDNILKDEVKAVIPDNWIYMKAEYVSHFITKGTTPKSDKLYPGGGEIPFLKVYNLTHVGKLDFSIEPTFTDEETHRGFLKRSIVYPNDVLMNIVGPPLGKVSIVPNTYTEWNINQAIVRFRPYENINNKFLMYYLLFEKTIVSMTKQAKATAGQLNLTLEICRNVQVPYCTLEEQNQIVQEIESRFSICDTLEYTIGESLNKAELLKQSILKKAFNGELTKEWREKNRDLITGDNSAESLLKKIKEEKEKLLKDK